MIRKTFGTIIFWTIVFPGCFLLALIAILLLFVTMVVVQILKVLQVPFELVNTMVTTLLRLLIEKKSRKKTDVVMTIGADNERMQ